MSDLEDQINSILTDPEQMAQIRDLARSLMGGQEVREDTAAGPEAPERILPEADIPDSAAIGRISRLLHASAAGRDDAKALLEAMMPYLSEKRRGKMERALRIARLARIAQLAMGEQGEGEHV